MTGANGGGVAELPPSTRIRVIEDTLRKARTLISGTVRGGDRSKIILEVESCLQHLEHIDAALKRAKGIVIAHREMCGRLREAAERHGLEIGDDYLDQVIIAALDRLKGAS